MGMYDGLHPRVRTAIEQFQQKYPQVQITSGFRDQGHNAAVGGAKGSQHIHGNAFDGKFPADMPAAERIAAIRELRGLGANGLGNYGGDSFHADWRSGPPAAWGPNYSRTSLGQTAPWFREAINSNASPTALVPRAGGGVDVPNVPVPPERSILASAQADAGVPNPNGYDMSLLPAPGAAPATSATSATSATPATPAPLQGQGFADAVKSGTMPSWDQTTDFLSSPTMGASAQGMSILAKAMQPEQAKVPAPPPIDAHAPEVQGGGLMSATAHGSLLQKMKQRYGMVG